MLKTFITAASIVALSAGMAQAQDAMTPQTDQTANEADAGTAMMTPPPALAPSATDSTSPDTVSDADLASFNAAFKQMSSIAEQLNGAAPSAEQQTQMASAVESSGLDINAFNAISASVSSDPVLRARLGVLNAAEPAEGSVAKAVTDAEVEQFSSTMVKMRQIAPEAGATPTTEQQAEMASTVQNSGLEIDRFNEIATAVSQDGWLRARVELADARRGV